MEADAMSAFVMRALATRTSTGVTAGFPDETR